MPIFGNISSIIASSGSIPTSSFQILPFYVADPSYGLGSTSSIAASINANILTQSSAGVAAEMTFNLSSPQTSNTSGTPILILSATGSVNEPRVGIGVAASDALYSLLDIRSPTGSVPASIILRTNEDGVIEVGEETGRITFAIESSSYLNTGFIASGSTAAIYSRVIGSSPQGTYGSLIFEVNDASNITSPTKAVEIGYGLGASSTEVGIHMSGTLELGSTFPYLSIVESSTSNQVVYLGTTTSPGAPFDQGELFIKDGGTTTIRLDSNGDSYINTGNNFSIGTTTATEKLTVDGNISVTGTVDGVDVSTLKSDFDTLEGKTLVSSSAQISVNELDGQYIEYFTRTSAYGNGSYEGEVLKWDSDTTQTGKTYVYSGGVWTATDADSENKTKGLFGIALGTNSGTDGMLIKGARASSAYAFTAGDILYISATEGTITSTAPSTSGQFVRIVGYALNANTIMVNPSQDWIELS
jgi:hypothetical protein